MNPGGLIVKPVTFLAYGDFVQLCRRDRGDGYLHITGNRIYDRAYGKKGLVIRRQCDHTFQRSRVVRAFIDNQQNVGKSFHCRVSR